MNKVCLPRLKQLDGLRFFAIITIILSHLEFLKELKFGNVYWNHFHNATWGVDYFFILSGFGLFYSLLNTGVSNGDVPANVNVYIVFLIYLLNSVISYFLFAYKSSILNANQRLDIENKLSTVVSLITYFAQTLILLLCSNIYVYLIVLPLSTTILNIIRAKIVDRLFPSENFIGKLSAEERKDIRTKVLATFFFKIESIVIKMADSIVISSFLGLVTLANYNNYFLILNGIMGFLEVIQSSIRPSIGNSIVSESVEKNYFDMKKLFLCFHTF